MATIRNQKMFCEKCGSEQAIPFPIAIPIMTAMINAFEEMHKDCEQTWTQPEVDQSLGFIEKTDFWLDKGERGTSSEVMFQKLSGKDLLLQNKIQHPCDPADFRRCYLLLETIPEWKSDLHKLKELSPVWSKLVDNWDKLTEMLLEQMQTKEVNGMFEFMESLGC